MHDRHERMKELSGTDSQANDNLKTNTATLPRKGSRRLLWNGLVIMLMGCLCSIVLNNLTHIPRRQILPPADNFFLIEQQDSRPGAVRCFFMPMAINIFPIMSLMILGLRRWLGRAISPFLHTVLMFFLCSSLVFGIPVTLILNIWRLQDQYSMHLFLPSVFVLIGIGYLANWLLTGENNWRRPIPSTRQINP